MGALMLLLNVEILALGRMAITDSVLIFFTTMSLYSFWLGIHEQGAGRHWIWGFYVGMALATLTKGPVGFAVPLITALLYLIATRQWLVFWQRGAPIVGTLLFVLSWPVPGIPRCFFSMVMRILPRPRSTQWGDSSLRWKDMEWDGGFISPFYSWAFTPGARSYPPRSIEPMPHGGKPPLGYMSGMVHLEQASRQDPVMNWTGLQPCG